MARRKLECGEWGKIKRSVRDDGVWFARARFRDMTGTMRTAYASASSGAKAEQRLKNRMNRRLRARSSDTTVRVVAKAWLAHSTDQAKMSGNTLYQHNLRLKNHVLPKVGDVEIGDVTVSMLEKLVKNLEESISKSTARTTRTTLCLVFDFAKRFDIVDRNMARRTSTVNYERAAVRAISIENVRLLLHLIRKFYGSDVYSTAARSKAPMADIMWTMIGTGMRAGEALALNWGDIDFKNGVPSTLRIERTITIDAQGRRKVGKSTKTGVNRTVTIPASVEEIFRRRYAEAEDTSHNAAVFTNIDGGRTPTHTFYYQWDRFKAKNPDFAWVKPHTFRKSVATLIAAKHGISRAAAQMGHSSETTTLKHYIQRNDVAPDSTDVFDQMVIASASDTDDADGTGPDDS